MRLEHRRQASRQTHDRWIGSIPFETGSRSKQLLSRGEAGVWIESAVCRPPLVADENPSLSKGKNRPNPDRTAASGVSRARVDRSKKRERILSRFSTREKKKNVGGEGRGKQEKRQGKRKKERERRKGERVEKR